MVLYYQVFSTSSYIWTEYLDLLAEVILYFDYINY